ncbi:hypothetical protein FE257_008686 [Aspergillus nanangensis]|uniref:Exosome complex protein n=1 Tax=Aspergillus nanangensis TaxID=2582783 RepID=A0AAD4CMD1_ASPNN|nr:hypothetical protein FE257_008686 [Aspergillus nanangensis]
MDATDLLPLLEQLDDNVDDLEEVLESILKGTVTDMSKKLPVLDKAKFHVLVTYTLESLIFSYLRLHGVDAKEHPVFRELTRVKQYFAKIKELETEPEQRTMTLDKEAANRFIKHGLAGNDKLDLERQEQQAKEKARAQLKASLLARKATAETTVETSKTTESNLGSDEEVATQKTSKKKDRDGDSSAKSKSKKTKRSKEGRKEDNKERRKKKVESRKSRPT